MADLLYLIFFLLSFGQLSRISFFDQQVNIYLHEVVMAFFVIVSSWPHFSRLNRDSRGKKIKIAMLFFLGILLLSLINNFWKFSFFQNEVGFFYWARLALYFIFFGVLYRLRPKIGNAINIFVFLTLIFSILQYFLYPNLRNLIYLGWDPHQFRIFGTFLDTTTTGVIFVLIFYYTLFDKKVVKTDYIKYFTLSLIFVLILLTYSRIAYLSFIFTGIYFFSRYGLQKITLAIFFFVAILFILPRPYGAGVKLERIYSIESRVVDIQKGIELWKKYPIAGVGYNRIRFFKGEKSESHAGSGFASSFVTLLASAGIIGLIGGIGLIWVLWEYADRSGRALIILVSTASFFDNIFLNNFILLLFGVLYIYFNLLSHKKQSDRLM